MFDNCQFALTAAVRAGLAWRACDGLSTLIPNTPASYVSPGGREEPGERDEAEPLVSPVGRDGPAFAQLRLGEREAPVRANPIGPLFQNSQLTTHKHYPSVKNAHEIARQLEKDWLIDGAKRSALKSTIPRRGAERELFMKIHHTLYFVTIGLLSLPQLMSGQDQKAPNAILKKQLETYDNPPAYIYRLETGPRMIVPYGPFVSYQANVDANGNNIVGDAANECSIAVDPTNRNKMVIGWRQFNSVTSNFRQGGWGYTTDAGLTWHFPGVLENNVFRSDPVLSFDETGRFFYNSLLQSLCDNIYRSINGGQSWTELQADAAAGGGDKQWFTIDRTNGTGHGFQYQAWDTSTCSGSGQFSRSTDGGATWQATISLPNSIQFGTLDVDTNGNLFVGGEPASGTGGFRCLRSSNAQNGGQTPTFDRTTTVNLGGQLNGGGINPAGLTGQSFLAIDKSGGPTNNNVYMLASVTPTTQSSGTEVMFARSTDDGQTFSAPVRITDDPVVVGRWHWFGTFAVAPNGRLDAVWYDTRNSGNNINSQLFYSYSIDAGVTWSQNVAVTPAFNPQEGYPEPEQNRRLYHDGFR